MITISSLDEMVLHPVPAGREQNTGIRVDKVRQIRRKLKSGKYMLTEHLDIAIDRLIEKILG